jgi:hypothetical protein
VPAYAGATLSAPMAMVALAAVEAAPVAVAPVAYAGVVAPSPTAVAAMFSPGSAGLAALKTFPVSPSTKLPTPEPLAFAVKNAGAYAASVRFIGAEVWPPAVTVSVVGPIGASTGSCTLTCVSVPLGKTKAALVPTFDCRSGSEPLPEDGRY